MHTCVSMCKCMAAHICIYVSIYVYTHIQCQLHAFPHMDTGQELWSFQRTHTTKQDPCMHIYIYIYINVYTHTHTHIYNMHNTSIQWRLPSPTDVCRRTSCAHRWPKKASGCCCVLLQPLQEPSAFSWFSRAPLMYSTRCVPMCSCILVCIHMYM
jgi:hypothetical protein